MTCACGRSASRPILSVASYRIVACHACGLWRTCPSPSLETLRAAYGADYAPHHASGAGTHGRGRRRIWVVPDLPRGARLLEIGSASGRFAQYARADRGWTVTEVDGVGAAEALTPPAGAYDAVVGWQTLEHCLDPAAVLRMAHTALAPAGWLILSVPNIRSVERWRSGAGWTAWQVPVHLWHFSPRTLRQLVERCGFRVQRIYQQRVFKELHGWMSDAVGTVVAACGLSSRMTLVARPVLRDA